MNTYFLCATQSSNLGDLIINKMLIDELCRYGIVFVDTTGIPDTFKHYLLESERTVDLGSLNLSSKDISFIRLLSFLKKNNVKIAVQSPGPVYDFKGIKRIVYRTQNFLFSAMGLKAYGIGKCCSSLIAKNEKMCINGIDHYYVRSLSSVNYINAQRDGMASYIPDLAFLMKYYVSPASKKKSVAVSFRGQSNDRSSFLVRCKQVVDAFLQNGYKVHLYYQVSSDKTFMEDLFKECYNHDVSFRDSILWFDELDFYADKMFVVSNRLHSLLTGAVYDCVPLALYDNVSECTKLRHVLATVFAPGALELQNEKDVADSVNSFIMDYRLVSGKVKDATSMNARLCRDVISEIVSQLNN